MAMAGPLLEKIDLDDVLVKFSIRGRYHAVAILWLSLGMVYNAMCYCNYVFAVENVGYRCADNNSTNTGVSKAFDTGNAQNANLVWCQNPESCAQWVYDNPDSFTAEFQLACQDWKRNLVGTVHTFGYMIGLLLVGPMSDRLGRKTLIIFTGVAGGLCGLAKSFVNYYWLYVVFEFFEAALGDPCSPIYMLALEMVATNSRVTYTSICNLAFPIGGILFPLTKWLVPYWRTFLRVLYAPGLLFIFLIYLIDESPRWLLSKGKTKEAVKIIEHAAKINKIDMNTNLQMLSCETDKSSNFKTAITDTFKSRSLLKRFFVCTIWWTASTFVSHGLTINSVLLEGDKFINYALSSAVEIPSNFIVAYALNKFRRRGPLIVSFVACAVMCIGHPFIPSNLLWLVITMYMISKLISTNFFSITYIFTSELFPTHTRNSMHALCSSVGRIGGMVAPQTSLLMVYWTGLPTLLFGVVSLIAGLATFLVPDTANKALPDTVGQAEAMEIKDLTGEEDNHQTKYDSTNL